MPRDRRRRPAEDWDDRPVRPRTDGGCVKPFLVTTAVLSVLVCSGCGVFGLIVPRFAPKPNDVAGPNVRSPRSRAIHSTHATTRQ